MGIILVTTFGVTILIQQLVEAAKYIDDTDTNAMMTFLSASLNSNQAMDPTTEIRSDKASPAVTGENVTLWTNETGGAMMKLLTHAMQSIDTVRVEAGGGNSTDVKTVFVPQIIEIKAGQTINWYNPTPVEEPHSVTFLKDNSLFPLFAVPFAVPNSTEFKALMPGPNVDPLIVPSNDTATKNVIVTNARTFNPTVIDSTGRNVTYLPPNANYTMDGTESYVNSGWMWPLGQVPPGAMPITEFTVTFEKPGIYNYVCTLHPWMTGTVIVS